MSRTRIVGGVYTKITGGDYKMYTGGDTIITAAGKNDFANAESVIIGNNPEKAPLLVMNDPESINFLVHFKTTDNYDYSFGFDWMRKKYRRICKNYKALKQEYVPVGESTLWKPKGKEYFTPWVCMHNGQKNVRLKIEIEVLTRKGIKDNDIIVLPQQKGISFSLDEINVNEIISKGFVEVEVCCDTVSEEDRLFLVLDKWKNTVGKLNFFKNKTTYQLDVRFVEVKFKGSVTQIPQETMNNEEKLKAMHINPIAPYTRMYSFTDDTMTIYTDPIPGNNKPQPLGQEITLNNWKTHIKDEEIFFKKLLDQTLVNYNPIRENNKVKYEEMIIDLENFNIGGYLQGSYFVLPIKESFKDLDLNFIHCDLGKLRESIIDYYLNVFLNNYNSETIMEQIKGVTFFVFPINIKAYQTKSLDALSDELKSEDMRKDGSRFVLLLNYSTDLRTNTIVHEIAHTLGLSHTYKEKNNNFPPKYLFTKDKTDNIMDEGREHKNNNSFWKWQWEEMQKDSDLKPIDNE